MNGNDRDTELRVLRSEARTLQVKIADLQDGKHTILCEAGVLLLQNRLVIVRERIYELANYRVF